MRGGPRLAGGTRRVSGAHLFAGWPGSTAGNHEGRTALEPLCLCRGCARRMGACPVPGDVPPYRFGAALFVPGVRAEDGRRSRARRCPAAPLWSRFVCDGGARGGCVHVPCQEMSRRTALEPLRLCRGCARRMGACPVPGDVPGRARGSGRAAKHWGGEGAARVCAQGGVLVAGGGSRRVAGSQVSGRSGINTWAPVREHSLAAPVRVSPSRARLLCVAQPPLPSHRPILVAVSSSSPGT